MPSVLVILKGILVGDVPHVGRVVGQHLEVRPDGAGGGAQLREPAGGGDQETAACREACAARFGVQ